MRNQKPLSNIIIKLDPAIEDGLYYCSVISKGKVVDKISYGTRPENVEWKHNFLRKKFGHLGEIEIKVIFKFE